MSSANGWLRSKDATLMNKICQKRQEKVCGESHTTVTIDDIKNQYDVFSDKTVVEKVIKEYSEDTGFTQIVGTSIMLNESGKRECNRLI